MNRLLTYLIFLIVASTTLGCCSINEEQDISKDFYNKYPKGEFINAKNILTETVWSDWEVKYVLYGDTIVEIWGYDCQDRFEKRSFKKAYNKKKLK